MRYPRVQWYPRVPHFASFAIYLDDGMCFANFWDCHWQRDCHSISRLHPWTQTTVAPVRIRNSWTCIHSTCSDVHWASKETYHFFKATHIKIQSIKMNHNWAQISSSTPYQACTSQKTNVSSSKKKKKSKIRWKSQEVIAQYSGYITRLRNWIE